LSVLLVFNITDETVQVRYDGAPEMDRTAAPSQMEYGEMESNTGIRSEEQAEDTVMMKSEEGTGDNRDRDLPADDAPASRLLQREVPAMMPAEPPPRDMRAVPESIAPLSPPPSITTESAGRAAGSSTQPRSGEAGTGDEAVSDRVESPADDGSDQEITVTAARRGSPVECTTPRPEFCADIYQPVCAVRDTGVRCITTPCDSTEEVEYGNACEACSDPDVISYTEGRCEQE
jgi:hypothetical protein